MRRWRQRAKGRPGGEPAAALSALAQSASEAVAGGGQALDRLVDRLLDIDRSGDPELAYESLAWLQRVPRVVARLDEHARRVLWRSESHSTLVDEAANRVRDNIAGPIAVALASTHRDGHIREAAVARMLAAPDPRWMPFLVLRTGDWVKPVRDRARAGLALLLADDPHRYLPAVLGMTLLARARLRGGFAYAQAVAALVHAPQSLRSELLASEDSGHRRWVLDLGLGLGWWTSEVLFAIAVTEREPRTRARVAELVCRQAVWTRQTNTLRRLARHPTSQVRAAALTGLVRLGQDAEVAGNLDDAAALVRAIAVDAARRTGIDVRDRYRAAVAAGHPPLGAIAGFAETGNAAHAPLLHDLLTHPAWKTRAHALRALRHLQAVPVELAVALLRDPAPAVVREATTTLRPLTRAVPDQVAWDLLADPQRVELRRAGYRLLRVRGLPQQLRAALLLASDPAASLARRAIADATRLARDAASPSWRMLTLPALDASADQIIELANLTNRAAKVLGEDTTRMLHAWLAKTENR